MKVTSTLKYARISPQKTRLIIDMIRGSDVLAAMRLVKFLPQKAAKIVSKVLSNQMYKKTKIKIIFKKMWKKLSNINVIISVVLRAALVEQKNNQL